MEEQKAKAEKKADYLLKKRNWTTGFKVFKLDSSNINAWDSDPDNEAKPEQTRCLISK